MRRVLVNAQIKAMVSLIESLMNIGYVIIVAFTVRTSFGTLVIMVSLYMVVLPYSFLMNTSHNKNRIIEHGWKNVFNNILGRKQIALDNPSADPKATTSNLGRKDDNDLTNDQHACANSSQNQVARGKEEETDSTTNTSAQNEGEGENSESCNVKRKQRNDLGKEMSERCDANVFVTKSYVPKASKVQFVTKCHSFK